MGQEREGTAPDPFPATARWGNVNSAFSLLLLRLPHTQNCVGTGNSHLISCLDEPAWSAAAHPAPLIQNGGVKAALDGFGVRKQRIQGRDGDCGCRNNSSIPAASSGQEQAGQGGWVGDVASSGLLLLGCMPATTAGYIWDQSPSVQQKNQDKLISQPPASHHPQNPSEPAGLRGAEGVQLRVLLKWDGEEKK